MRTSWEDPRPTHEAGADDAGHPEQALLARARAFAEPLLADHRLDTGEPALGHAQGVAAILRGIGAPPAVAAAAYLVYAGDHLQQPEATLARAFGPEQGALVAATRQLVEIQRAARSGPTASAQPSGQVERVRKMLLAFSRDLRVVLLRLASRLQTLRWHAAARRACPPALAGESLQVFAPLANRLGIWQLKWELEDLAFRFLQPDDYRSIAANLDETRVEREAGIEAFRQQLAALLSAAGIEAEVAGRPKHLYGIWKKMQGKHLGFERIHDLRAVRAIVADVGDCYGALARVHARFAPVVGEFDDYIARPKANGYRSLHTVVRDDDGRPVEVQIRSREMHVHAEHGVAAHWAYKEAGVKGYAGAAAPLADAQSTEARKALLRQLLAWEHELVAAPSAEAPADERIYIFTPQARIVELPAGATPIDFAYALHTELGHHCRGARIDGQQAPLNTALKSGQTVEISSVREGGPSLDWLNPELGYLRAPRSRTKVRAWFNAQQRAQTVARGREAVEKLLQREGRTAMRLGDLASMFGYADADALFEAVARDELSLRTMAERLRPAVPPGPEAPLAPRRPPGRSGRSVPQGVLVVGMESLMTHLAPCCRPAPPDAIAGYVTRGKGVAVHRSRCANFLQQRERSPERLIPVAWGEPGESEQTALYPLDVVVEATDRQGLLRDISEVFAKQRTNVVGVKTRSVRDAHGETAWMTFTIEVRQASQLAGALELLLQVEGVRRARRR